jgi:hypothetical protein
MQFSPMRSRIKELPDVYTILEYIARFFNVPTMVRAFRVESAILRIVC